MTNDAHPGTGSRAATGDILQYATGSLGMGVWVTAPGMLLLYFLTNVLDVSPFLAGATLLVPKIVDVILHPILGSISDRLARRKGHRRTLMWFGLALALGMVALYTVPPGFTGTPAAVWVGLWYTVGNILFACFQVPYVATPSDLKVGYYQRARIFMFRMLVLTIGLLVTGVLAGGVAESDDRSAYIRLAIMLGGGIILTGFVGIVGVRRLNQRNGFRTPDPQQHSFLDDVSVAWRDRDFRWLVLSYLFTGITTHLFLAAVPYYAAYGLDREGITSVLMGAFLGPAVIAGPLWLHVSKRIGKHRGLLTAQTIFAVGAIALLAAGSGVIFAVAIVVAMGFGFAGMQLFAFSMVPDVVAAAESQGGARAGAYTGMWTATDSIGTAIGPWVYSIALGIGGFVSSGSGEGAEQSPAALRAVMIGFTVVPLVLMVIALACQSRYRGDTAAARG
jgi:Na+/melibiose symporter-like transporter